MIRAHQIRGTRLHAIIQKSEQLTMLTATIRAMLDPTIAEDCQVINYRAEVLVLQFSDPMKTTRLRLQLPDLLTRLQTALPDYPLVSIELKIQPAIDNPSITMPSLIKPFSARIESTFNHLAEKYPFLRKTLHRLIALNKKIDS